MIAPVGPGKALEVSCAAEKLLWEKVGVDGIVTTGTWL
jgi:hypothetical protein